MRSHRSRTARWLACLLLSAATAAGQPGAGDSLLAEARAALEAGRHAEAEALYRALVGRHPELDEAALGLARSLTARGRGRQAALELGRVAEPRLAAGDGEGAAVLLAEAVAADPEWAPAWALLGRAEVLARRYLKGEQALERARQLGDATLTTYLYLASALWENGKPDAAEVLYRDALAEHGARPDLLHPLGRLLLWLGRFQEARQVLTEAASRGGGRADLAFDLARATDGGEDRQAAVDAWRRAVQLAPEHSEIRYGYARSLSRAGERDEAQAELEVFRRLYEAEQERTRQVGLEEARLARGRALIAAGEARAAVEHLVSLPPTPDALAALAAAHGALGDWAACAEALERAVAQAPQRRDLRLRLAEARLAAGAGG